MKKLINRYAKVFNKSVNDMTASAISAPARAYYGAKKRNADYKRTRMKAVREETEMLRQMDEAGVPDKGNQSDKLFRYRANKALKNK